MFLLSKLSSSKNKRTYIIVIATVSIILGIVFVTSPWNSCGITHVVIQNDISQYYGTLDPEFCESIVYRIDEFNAQCSPEIEILDCG